ncbi:uncharacterized protein Dwil_GK13269 [Drosophila willistoni]|uniref:Uncharacterized protein n=1 Tax=Drosophila willistoni TaxID=7260 RepID=B4NKZ8_DROWI|nr:uncharacterized protein Dwil_GK13269 [Drosophila willistoni]
MCEPATKDPMSFLYLDLMANHLLRDIEEATKDFNDKMVFLREQESNILENVKNLISIDEFLDLLRKCVVKMEIELSDNENGLIEAERTVARLERSLTGCESLDGKWIPLQRSTYKHLLKLLLSADRSYAQCACLKDEIEDYNQELIGKVAPEKIGDIIDYHNKSLELLERQISELESQTEVLKLNFDQISKDMDISSLSTKLTCQTGQEIMADKNKFQLFKK